MPRPSNTALLLLISVAVIGSTARAAAPVDPPGYRAPERSDAVSPRKGKPARKKVMPRRPDVSPSDHRRRKPVDSPRLPFSPPGPPDEYETAAV